MAKYMSNEKIILDQQTIHRSLVILLKMENKDKTKNYLQAELYSAFDAPSLSCQLNIYDFYRLIDDSND